MNETQKKNAADRMKAGREAKAAKEKLIKDQAAEIAALKAQLSNKNVENTVAFEKKGEPNPTIDNEISGLKQQLKDLENVLSATGALPKKIATKPWHSIHKPFAKDIFKTKGKHDGFKLYFISEHELDDYKADGFAVARGENYGEKEGIIKRKRMIGVELSVAEAQERKEMQRRFNLAQETSALQKTKDISDNISRISGRKTDLQMGYEVGKRTA